MKKLVMFAVLLVAVALVFSSVAYFVAADDDRDGNSDGDSDDDDRDSDDDRVGGIGGRDDDSDDGRETEERTRVERIFVDENGVERRVRVEIREIERDGFVERRIKFSDREGGEIETELEIREEVEIDDNGEEMVRVRARLEDGEEKEVRVLPEGASDIARVRLRLENVEIADLREVEHKNIPAVVYHIEGDKPGRFLGIFKIAMNVESDIDAETGEEVSLSKPWWAFLVAEDDDGLEQGDDGLGENETEEENNESGIGDVNDTELEPPQNITP